jgi:preprotein translocase subunit YajC
LRRTAGSDAIHRDSTVGAATIPCDRALRPAATYAASGDSYVFISSAYAQASGATSQADMLTSFLPMIAIFVVFYFLLIRPQQKRAREQRELLTALEKGNEVVTGGGLVGRISRLSDQYVTMEIAPNVEVTVQRASVTQLLPKGTLKSL